MAGILGLLMSGAGLIKDQYFNLTTLLLPGNGTNGAQNNTFLDSSSNNFTITRNGNTTQGTFSPFSQTGWGNYFDGSGDYLTVPTSADFNLGTGAFTFETWVNPTASGAKGIFQGSSAGLIIQINASNKAVVRLYAVADLITSTDSIALNTWTHIAVARSGTTLSMWINGSRSAGGTVTDSSNFAQTGFVIGANETFANQFSGYMSNLRLVKGTAVYDPTLTSISVPTTPLTAITNTSILTCQANRFVDSNTTTTPKTITVNGNPSVVAFSPFAPTAAYTTAAVGGSGYFDGTGDYLNVVSDSNLALGTGDFTIEMWMYPTLLSATVHNFFDFRPSGTQGGYPAIYINNSAFNYYANSAIRITNSTIPTVNAWNHIALVRSGTTTKLYLNGAQVGNDYTSDTTNYLCPANRPGIGGGGIDTSNPFPGYLSNIRILKGTALYTGTTYTVPTAPPAAITNTQLLLNFTNAGITDATAKNDLETVGNAQISTSVSKFPGGSIAFDGSGDWLIAPPTQNLALGSGDFTIETWIYPIAYSGSSIYPILIANGSADAAAAGEFSFYINHPVGSTIIYFNTSGTGQSLSGGSIVATGGWSHVAISRSSGTLRVFINGAQQYSGACTASFGLATNQTTIGVRTGNTAQTSFNGYMDDLRITRGLARYTANFTPPTAPFPVQ